MLNFTRQERVVIYFLIITLGLGAVLKLVKSRYLVDEVKPSRFYREEQQFESIANEINSKQSTSVDSALSDVDQSGGMNVPNKSENDLELAPININTAGVNELVELPGIGPAIAKRIKAYTEQNGPFKNKAEIILVKGIGEILYSRIEGLVTTE